MVERGRGDLSRVPPYTRFRITASACASTATMWLCSCTFSEKVLRMSAQRVM